MDISIQVLPVLLVGVLFVVEKCQSSVLGLESEGTSPPAGSSHQPTPESFAANSPLPQGSEGGLVSRTIGSSGNRQNQVQLIPVENLI